MNLKATQSKRVIARSIESISRIFDIINVKTSNTGQTIERMMYFATVYYDSFIINKLSTISK